jgi:hypothetical protein
MLRLSPEILSVISSQMRDKKIPGKTIILAILLASIIGILLLKTILLASFINIYKIKPINFFLNKK